MLDNMHHHPPAPIFTPSGAEAVATFAPAPYAWSVTTSYSLTFRGPATAEDKAWAIWKAGEIWSASYDPERNRRLGTPPSPIR